MHIHHLAIWCADLEKMRRFYLTYFGATCGEMYYNPRKNFSSYLLTLEADCRIELMHKPEITGSTALKGTLLGLAHFSVSTGSPEAVDALTERLRHDGYTVVSEPRTTGDGFYESCIADPEGNQVEITV